MALRPAQIQAETVVVLCPYCSEPQPNADGSDMWTKEEVTKEATKVSSQGKNPSGEVKSKRTCVSCDEQFFFFDQNKVVFK